MPFGAAGQAAVQAVPAVVVVAAVAVQAVGVVHALRAAAATHRRVRRRELLEQAARRGELGVVGDVVERVLGVVELVHRGHAGRAAEPAVTGALVDRDGAELRVVDVDGATGRAGRHLDRVVVVVVRVVAGAVAGRRRARRRDPARRRVVVGLEGVAVDVRRALGVHRGPEAARVERRAVGLVAVGRAGRAGVARALEVHVGQGRRRGDRRRGGRVDRVRDADLEHVDAELDARGRAALDRRDPGPEVRVGDVGRDPACDRPRRPATSCCRGCSRSCSSWSGRRSGWSSSSSSSPLFHDRATRTMLLAQRRGQERVREADLDPVDRGDCLVGRQP